MSTFPRDVRSVHQIEIVSDCNLRCVYCPSKNIVDGKYPNRSAVHITRENFERALDWVRFFVLRQTQTELNIAGIGESTLHENFVEFVKLARGAIGNGRLVFATNGLIHDEEMVRAIAPYNPRVSVSLHRPEKAAVAIQVYRKYGLFEGASSDPALNANSWAGQVEWHDHGFRMPCQFLRHGKVFVMADGRISRCCLDASGSGVLGHVRDPIGSIQTSPYELCKKCYQDIGASDWDQQKGCAI